MRKSKEQIRAALDSMARRFEERAIPIGASGNKGWGQFLDGPEQHAQFGLYGTCSGLLVRALAGRGHDEMHSAVVKQLRDWWVDPDVDTAAKLSQTPRLAFLHLALMASAEQTFAAEVAAELARRALPTGLYSDSTTAASVTPRVLPTAAVLLSHRILGRPLVNSGEGIVDASGKLADLLIGQQLQLLEFAIGAGAVLSSGIQVPTKLTRRLRAHAVQSRFNLEDFGVYFLEYSAKDGEDRAPKRDYFIAPTSVILALTGLLPGAPGSLRVRAEQTIERVVENIVRNHAFVAGAGGRVSSKNQAWAAILLATKSENPIRWRDRFDYALRKHRKDNWFTGVVWPLVAYALSAAGAAYSDGAMKAVPTMGGLVIGGIYPIQRVLDRLLRRTDDSV